MDWKSEPRPLRHLRARALELTSYSVPSNCAASVWTRPPKALMDLVVVRFMDINCMYIILISASDFWVEAESSMDLKIPYPPSCYSTVKRVLVLASMILKNLSFSDDSSSGWIVAIASMRVPVTFSWRNLYLAHTFSLLLTIDHQFYAIRCKRWECEGGWRFVFSNFLQ